MSQDLKKNNLRKQIVPWTMTALMGAILLCVLIGPPAYFVTTPYENIEKQQEALDNSNYNWTEVNYTTFETKVSCGFLCSTTIAEEQCANGVQEACEYVQIKNVDYHDRNNFQEQIYLFGATMFAVYTGIIVFTSPVWVSFLFVFLLVRGHPELW